MNLEKRHFVFIIGSARHAGNTELLARHAAGFLPGNARQTWLNLIDHPLPLFEDIRHEEDRKYSLANFHEEILLRTTLDATDLVIASPVYWYSLSAATKLYIDHWSAWMRLPEVDFRSRMSGKRMWGVTALSDENFSGVQPLIDMLRMSADYMDMHWTGVLVGYGNRPGEVLKDTASLERAKRFFASFP